MSRLLSRIEANAEAMMAQYPTASGLLHAAMNEAMPWAVALKTRRRVPELAKLERLATQIVAILMASTPPEGGAPVPAAASAAPPDSPEPKMPLWAAGLGSTENAAPAAPQGLKLLKRG